MRRLSLSGRELLILGAATAACVAAWLLPGAKPGAVAGRLNYGQFVLALLVSALLACIFLASLASPARRRLARFRAAAVCLSTTAAILVWEIAAFLWPQRPLMDNPAYLFSGQGFEGSAALPFERPAHMHWEGLSSGDLAGLNEDADPYATQVTFVTDHEGFRNGQDWAHADLVFLGDSFTEAGNIAERDTFVQRTAAALGRTARNLGRAGYTGPTELIVLQKYGLRCRPRTVVWQIAESNDLIEALTYAEWMAAGRPDYLSFIGMRQRTASGRQFSPTWRLFRWLREPPSWPRGGAFQDREGRIHQIRFEELPSRMQSPVKHPGWPILAESLRAGANLLRDENVPLLVLLVPMKARGLGSSVRLNAGSRAALVSDWNIPAFGAAWDDPESGSEQLIGSDGDMPEAMTLATHLRKLCDELGVLFVDATPPLRAAAAAGDLVYQPFDTHLSPEGHRVVSEALVEELKKRRK